jgi:Tfp pilus assembly protein PilF
VAEQLNVGFVLEGSVRKSGNRVRITAQLIEARSDTHLWSETYDRTLDDLFAIQDEISTAIVAALRGELKLDIGAAPQATGTANPEAHDAVLRGAYALAQRIPGSKARARAEFEKAVALDPDYALAHAQLAITLFLGGCEDMPDAQCAAKSASHAEKSLALAPGLAEAHTAKAWQADLEDDVEGARMHFRRAIEINPNDARVYVWMAGWGLMSSLDQAYAALETAVRLDPISPLSNNAYVSALLTQNRLEEADRQIEKYAMIDPRFAIALRGRRSALGGNWANYILAYLEAAKGGAEDLTYSWALEEDMMWHLAAIGLQEEALLLAGGQSITALAWLGDPQGALALAQEWDAANSPQPMLRLVMSFALAQTGRYAEARPVLEKSWQSLGRRMPGLEVNAWMAYHAEALVAALRDAGEETAANQVLAEFKDWVRRNREAGTVMTSWDMSVDYFEGLCRYFGGERDAGLALMSRAAEDGYWIRPPAPFQQPMYQDPGFAAILERQKARQAREREKVLSVVCANNPYAEVWQPTETTCEEYFSAGQG